MPAEPEEAPVVGSNGKPKRAQISTSISSDLLDKLRSVAKDEDRTVSSVVHRILKSHFANK